MVLKESFKDLKEDELNLLRNSYDVIGDIAILEIPIELRRYEKRIANELLKLKHVNTVVRKEGKHEGICRLQKYKFLSGIDKKETIHKENGVKIKLDIEKVYFSSRLGNERLRIARQIKPCESVLVMFSGCGIYPLVLARNSRAKEIYGVEINKNGCKYAEENLRLNDIGKIRLFCGDIKKFKLDRKFDRILMPLPINSKNFLVDAKRFSKKGTIVHYYVFSDCDYKREIKAVFKEFNLISIVKCGQASPRIFRLCVDFKI